MTKFEVQVAEPQLKKFYGDDVGGIGTHPNSMGFNPSTIFRSRKIQLNKESVQNEDNR